jgi:hypothetical protein
MTDADQLKMNLRLIIGATVMRVGLWIWPDANRLEDTDVGLYLELRRIDGNDITIIFRTSPDGQTPAVEWPRIPDGIPISELKHRQKVWSRDGFWESQEFYSHELFLVSPFCNEPIAPVNGQQITAVFAIFLLGDQQLSTGLHLRFGNGTDVWVVPGNNGSQVFTDSTCLCWPEPVVECDVGAI